VKKVMGPRKKRKVKKIRGTRTCGGGSHKKRRGAGSRGGRGRAGSHKHHYIKMIKIGWEFGKHGFTRPKNIRRLHKSLRLIRLKLKKLKKDGKIDEATYKFFYSRPEINVGDLDLIIDKLVELGLAEMENKKYKLDLSIFGYTKLLGRGDIKKPIVVRVSEATETAMEKIRKAGGEVALVAE